MAVNLISGEKEQTLLRELLTTKESEFVALYGRGGVGKTFLAETVSKEEMAAIPFPYTLQK